MEAPVTMTGSPEFERRVSNAIIRVHVADTDDEHAAAIEAIEA
jgi:hypothetical protein